MYDYQQAQARATDLLQTRAERDPNLGAAYALSGPVALTVRGATTLNTGAQVSLNVQAQGRWVYRFSTALLHQLAIQIAGKSQADARVLLLRQPGIVGVKFTSTGTLPANPDDIHIVSK